MSDTHSAAVVYKSILEKFDDLTKAVIPQPAPQLHSTVEGFMSGFRGMPQGPDRNKFITAHMNHAPFLTALGGHPQGAQIKNTLNNYMNSAANAGFRPGATQVTVKSEIDVADVLETLRKTAVEKIKAGMAELQKAEDEGKEKLNKGIGSLPSTTPSEKELHSNYLNKKAVLPHVGKEVSAEGSGGQVTKGQKLGKAALPMQMPKPAALKPPGVPAAKIGQAPKAPTTPKAPGATNPVAKTQLQSEGAVGANSLMLSELESMEKSLDNMFKTRRDIKAILKDPKQRKDMLVNAGKAIQNREGIPTTHEQMSTAYDKVRDEKTKKMELPHSSTKASGGQMAKMDLPTSATIPTGIKVSGNPEGVQHGDAGSTGSSGDHQYQPGSDGSVPSPKSPPGLPTTSAVAIGGQTVGATVPAGPDVSGRPGATQTPETKKMELPTLDKASEYSKRHKNPQMYEVRQRVYAREKMAADRNSTAEVKTPTTQTPETKKMELPHTNQNANRGKVTGASVPAGPSVKGLPGAVQKMELPQTATKADGGQKSSAKVPAGPEVKGRPGAVQKDEMSSEETPLTEESSATEIHKGHSVGGADLNKMAMHPSPVFNVLRQGGAAGVKQAMMSDPKAGPAPVATPATPPAPMPTQAVHAQRAAGFSDFMPQGKFGKSELQEMEKLLKAYVQPGQLQTEARQPQTDVALKGNPSNLHPMTEWATEGGEVCAGCQKPIQTGNVMLSTSQDPYYPQFCGPECAMKGGQSEAQKFFQQMEQKPPPGPAGATAQSPLQGNFPQSLKNNENKLDECPKCRKGMTLCKC